MGPVSFHKILLLLANGNTSVEVKNDELVCHDCKKGESPKITEQAAKQILTLLSENKDNVQKNDEALIKKLKIRIQNTVNNNEPLQTRIDEIRSSALNKSVKPAKSEEVITNPVICEISKPPTNNQELLKNINLVVNNPRYTLTESLAVIDIRRGQAPEAYSKIGVFESLKKRKNELLDSQENELILDAVSEAIDLYKPVNIVPLCIVMHSDPTPDNGAMESNLFEFINEKIPTLTTIMLVTQVNSAKLKKLNCSLYIQKEGGLALFLPPSTSLNSAGFNPEDFDRWEKPLTELVNRSVNIDRDFSSPFLNDQEDLAFRRLVNWHGHGSSFDKGLDKAAIAGLPITEFQTALEQLTKHGLDFLWLSSCFSGGENMTHIALPTGKLSCPIIVGSSTDKQSFSNQESTNNIFNLASIKLYPNEEIRNFKAKQLTQKDMRQIGSVAQKNDMFDKEGSLANMQSLLFPASKSDISHVGYTGFKSQGIFEVDQEVKRIQHKAGEFSDEIKIEDNNADRIMYFLNRPVIPAVITNNEVSTPTGFSSRGGRNFHVLNRVELPKIEFKDIVEETRNTRFYKDDHKSEMEGGSKLIALGSLKCLMNSSEVELQNVIIGTTSEGLLVAYKENSKSDKGKYRIFHSIEDLKNANSPPLTEEDFYSSFYSTAHACTPSKEQLKVTAASLQGPDDFFNHIQKVFWEDNPSLATKLCEAIVKEKSNEASGKLLSELPVSPEKKQKILDAAMMVAVMCNNQNVIDQLLSSGANIHAINHNGSPLSQAINSGNEAMILLLLSKGAKLNQPCTRDNLTPLQSAVKSRNENIIKLLIDNGADPNHVLKQGDLTPLYIAVEKGYLNIVKLLIEKGANPNQVCIDSVPLLKALELKKYNTAKLLLDSNADPNMLPPHAKETGFKLAIDHPELFKLIAKKCPEQDWNRPIYDSKLPVFYAIVKNKQLLKTLIELQVPLDVKDDNGFTPLQSAVYYGKDENTKKLLTNAGCKLEINEQLEEELEDILEEGLSSFYNSIKGTDIPIKKYKKSIENKIKRGGHLDIHKEAVEYMLEHGFSYPLTEEAHKIGTEASLANDASKKKFKAIEHKIKGGWKINPQHEKMQAVCLLAAKDNNEIILNFLKQNGIEVNTGLWLDNEWQKNNNISEDVVFSTLLSKNPDTLNTIDNNSLKKFFLKKAVSEGFEELNKFIQLKKQSDVHPIDFLKSELGATNKELQQLLLKLCENPEANGDLIVTMIDKNIKFDQVQTNDLILKSIELGQSEIIKRLEERGYRLKKLVPSDAEKLSIMLANKNTEELPLSLFAFLRSGASIHQLPPETRKIIENTIKDKLKDNPVILEMFAKKLHFSLT